MLAAAPLACSVQDRRLRLFDNRDWNGIDFVEVLPGQMELCVHFFGALPQNVARANVRIEGGRRIRDIAVRKVEPELAHDEELDDCLHVTLDRFGDFSAYRICLVEPLAASGSLVAVPAEQPRPALRGAAGLYQHSVMLSEDFALVAPPGDAEGDAAAYHLHLVRNPKSLDLPDHGLAHSIDLGPLRALAGRQPYRLPDDVEAEKIAGVLVRSDALGVIGYARLVRVEAKPEDSGALALPETIALSGLDPRYSCATFNFKVDCPSDLDCRPAPACPPETLPAPDINYLAKDYASFRQLMLDRLAVIMPDWRERHVPDLGITLVELLAYVGDHLSYYQDAVATEAYLDTARKRVSVRRHARLVDYRMHEGNNARAFVTVSVSGDLALDTDRFYFITGFAGIKASSGGVVQAEDLAGQPQQSYEVFEPLAATAHHAFRFRKDHSEIRIHAWGDRACCLPKGATRATLLDEPGAQADDPHDPAPLDHVEKKPRPPRALDLKQGDVLIFEEVVGPTTGNPADADPARRHAVRLSRDPVRSEDGLMDCNVLEIEWHPEDALPFSLCLSARLPSPDCRWIDGITVVRGNVVLVDHGRTAHTTFGPVGQTAIAEDCACEDSVLDVTVVPERFTATLYDAPLTFAEDCPPQASAARLMAQDPRAATPRLVLREITGQPPAPHGAEWSAGFDLLESGADARRFVAEIGEDGTTQLRFGDGILGVRPAGGTQFAATYRIGNGAAGNVGREAIAYLVLRGTALSGTTVAPRNPLPARGGTAPEPTALVKLLAPSAFRTRRERAITAEDYAELAQRNDAIQRAAAELCWMGSWYEARVSIDPALTQDVDPDLLREIRHYLYRYRRMGHDLATAPAEFVPVDLGLEVCVLPHYARGEITARLLEVFGNRQRADGTPGFFHPDQVSFGEGLYLSRIVAAAAAIDGVETVRVNALTRRDGLGGDALQSGVLRFGPFEVAQCDNDASFPERGKLTLKVRGGR